MSGEYHLVYTHRFVKDFRKLSNQNQVRVRRRLENLKSNPQLGRKLTNVDVGQFRLRVGNIRIRYDIDEQNIVLLRVLKREDAYRRD